VTVADKILSQAEELGYAHRDIAAMHEVLAERPAREPARTHATQGDH
jgi:hypothetical protein